MEVLYAKAAIKAIKAMDKPSKQRVKQAIECLPQGDIKLLKGSGGVLYRLRVGNWRIVFSFVNGNKILIEKIAPRGDVYKGRLFQ